MTSDIRSGVDECPYGRSTIDPTKICGSCEFYNNCELPEANEVVDSNRSVYYWTLSGVDFEYDSLTDVVSFRLSDGTWESIERQDAEEVEGI